MENEVTEKLVLFLQNLRCEDAGRERIHPAPLYKE